MCFFAIFCIIFLSYGRSFLFYSIPLLIAASPLWMRWTDWRSASTSPIFSKRAQKPILSPRRCLSHFICPPCCSTPTRSANCPAGSNCCVKWIRGLVSGESVWSPVSLVQCTLMELEMYHRSGDKSKFWSSAWFELLCKVHLQRS